MVPSIVAKMHVFTSSFSPDTIRTYDLNTVNVVNLQVEVFCFQ